MIHAFKMLGTGGEKTVVGPQPNNKAHFLYKNVCIFSGSWTYIIQLEKHCLLFISAIKTVHI